MHVVNKTNTTNMEWSLCKDLIAHTLHDLKRLPASNGLVNPRAISKDMRKSLCNVFGTSIEAADVQTAVKARNGSVAIHRGDVKYSRPRHKVSAPNVRAIYS